ncbi:hypothetical protein KCU93_g2666, partial [Aureobasidium melanogenum]
MDSSASSSEKQIVNTPGSRRSTKRPKLSAQDLEHEPIFSLYKDPSTARFKIDAQDANLDRFALLCRGFGWVPSVEMVEWLMKEANIMDEPCLLNFPAFAFMQEYKFSMCVAKGTERPRLFVGVLPHHGDWPLWADWSEFEKLQTNATTDNKTLLFEGPMFDPNEAEAPLEPYWRERIKWDKPLEELFHMSHITHGSRDLDAAMKIQDAILFNVAKVVLRFPGLMKKVPAEEELEGEILIDPSHGTFSKRPFNNREVSSPHNPFVGALAKLKSRSYP